MLATFFYSLRIECFWELLHAVGWFTWFHISFNYSTWYNNMLVTFLYSLRIECFWELLHAVGWFTWFHISFNYSTWYNNMWPDLRKPGFHAQL